MQRGRASIPLPWRDSFAVAPDHQLGANHQDLDITRINPGKSNSADQLVSLHGDFCLQVPTARPYPAGEEPFPTAEETIEQSIDIPLGPSRLAHGWRDLFGLGSIADTRGSRISCPEKGEQVFKVRPPARPVMPTGKFLKKAGAALGLKERNQPSMCGNKLRLVFAHVKIKRARHVEFAYQSHDLLLLKEKGAGLTTHLRKQVWPRQR